MEESSFFNDVDGDRIYYAEDFAEYFIPFFTNGIFNNGCQVLGNTNDMAVNVSTGRAFINGYRYRNKQSKTLTIENADGVLNRIDNIVIRLDLTNRNISTQVIKGSFLNNPVAPDLTRTSTIYDLRIAKVYIPAGTTEITQDLIEDCRFINSDCGNVISPIKTPDTEQLFIQMQAIFDKFIADSTNGFDTWFDSIKNQLDSDAAGNLQNQINNLNSNKVDNAKYDLDSNNLQLLANGKNVGDSVHIPTGITDEVSGEEDLKIVNNKGVVKFSLEGKTEQKTYTGKNLLNYIDNLQSINGLTNTINSDGSITTTGKPTTNYTLIMKSQNIIDKLEDGQTYTISQEITNGKSYIQINAKKKDGTYMYYNSISKKASFIIDKSLYVSYTVAIQSSTTSYWGDESLTITNKYMLCKGTDTADTSFEPYVGGQVSPSPNYPQEIENIKGIENLIDESLLIDTCTINGITLKKNDNNTFDLSGTVVDKDYNKQILILSKKIQSNKDYYFYCSQPYDGANFNICLRVYYTDETQQNIIPNKVARIANKTIRTVAVVFWAKVGTTITNANNVKIMLSEKVNDYVPYGSNYLQLENVGENILNIDETPFTVKKITSQGNVLYWSGYSGVNDFVKVKEKTTYKFSSNEVNKVCYIDYYDKNKNYLSRTGTVVDYFTTPENCKYIKFAINLELIPTNAQLMEGTIIKPYEPYQKKIMNIVLKGNNLCSNKDKSVKDELAIENGRVKINKKIKEVVLTGNESITRQTTLQSNKYRFNITCDGLPSINSDVIPDLLCSHFKPTNRNNTYNCINGITLGQNIVQIYDDTLSSMSEEEFKAKLKSLYDAGTPVIIQYPLSEPEIIDLGKVDFELLEGNSTLNLEEDLKSNMSIKYYIDSTVVDLKKKVENKQNVILHGTTVPENDLGEDGDIYLQHN
jgi:hypothetical protein|nr:MAG TPA: Receptor Binding Protein [Caudoviricetes sp.]